MSDVDVENRAGEQDIEISHLLDRKTLLLASACERVYIRHSGLVRSQLLVTRLLADV